MEATNSYIRNIKKWNALIFIIFFCISCQIESQNLNPTLEILSEKELKWQDNRYQVNELDSILTEYKNNIPETFYDSISITLVINKNVEIKTLSRVKNNLRKNNLLKLEYQVKK